MAFRPVELLRILIRHRADFVVVGGVAGNLAGSPVATADLDLVYDCTDANNERLLGALRELNARYKDPAGRWIVPDVGKLAAFRINLLVTDHGDLDLLQMIGENLRYQDLLSRSIPYTLEDLQLQAIDLETLIAAKEHADRPKDRYALPFLRQLLAMTSRSPR